MKHSVLALLVGLLTIGFVSSKTIYCSQNSVLYDEWNCTKKYRNPTDICPDEYDCSNVFDTPLNQCFLGGMRYAVNEEAKVDGMERNCRFGCFCDQYDETERARFTCAIADCMFWETNSTCKNVYQKVDQCCPEQRCDASCTRPRCKYGYQYVTEGERMIPNNDETCICQKNGKFHCEPNKCFSELDDGAYYIHSHCAPVFDYTSRCPVQWKCSDPTDEVIKRDPEPVNSPKCQLGTNLFNIGDKVMQTTDYETGFLCFCLTPPLMTCHRFT